MAYVDAAGNPGKRCCRAALALGRGPTSLETTPEAKPALTSLTASWWAAEGRFNIASTSPNICTAGHGALTPHTRSTATSLLGASRSSSTSVEPPAPLAPPSATCSLRSNTPGERHHHPPATKTLPDPAPRLAESVQPADELRRAGPSSRAAFSSAKVRRCGLMKVLVDQLVVHGTCGSAANERVGG